MKKLKWPSPEDNVLLKQVQEVLTLIDDHLTLPAQAHEATVPLMFSKIDLVFHTMAVKMKGNLFGKLVARNLKKRVHKILKENAGWQAVLYLHPESRLHLQSIAAGDESHLLSSADANKILETAPLTCPLLGQRLHKIALKPNPSDLVDVEHVEETEAASANAVAAAETAAARAKADMRQEDSEGNNRLVNNIYYIKRLH